MRTKSRQPTVSIVDYADKLSATHPLIEAVLDQRVALFLGAGASREAKDARGNEIPTGPQLAAQIAERFLDGQFKDSDFRIVYEFACSHRGGRIVQQFIHDVLREYEPAPHHMLLPTFGWVAIFTTNYDLIVERAYDRQKNRVQTVKSLATDEDAKSFLGLDREIPYYKLHGCVSQYQVVTPPLIATTSQIINARSGRAGLFDRFLEVSKNHTCVFIGYSFQDANMQVLVDELIKDGENHPPHYIVNKSMTEIEGHFWHEKRFRPIAGTFSALLNSLDAACPIAKRKLGAVSARMRVSPFTRWVSASGQTESDFLVRHLASQCRVITKEVADVPANPTQFYRGDSTGWSFLPADLDVKRRLLTPILQEQVLTGIVLTRPRVIVIKSHAGAGRTVFFKRLAWEAAVTHDRLCLFAEADTEIDPNVFAEIFRLTKATVHLFIDDVADRAAAIDDLLRKARQAKWPLMVFLSERNNQWNTECDETLGRYVDDEYEIGKLTPAEIGELLERLDTHKCLGELARFTPDKRVEAFSKAYDGILLVSLHEATRGQQFAEIVMDEYQSIGDDRARLLYLDICSLHRFGVPVRAGLISRIHDLSFDRFQEQFLRPLEKIVSVRWDGSIGDYTYTSRHKIIADLVYKSSVITPDEKLDNLIRLISRLNPSYSRDVDALNQLIHFNNLLDIDLSPDKGMAVYDLSRKQFGDQAFIFHQAACFLSARPQSIAQIDRASEQLAQALELQEGNRSFRHTEAEIALKRSRLTTSKEECVAARNRAIAIASGIAEKSRTPHAFHTIVKARLDGLKDAFRDYESTQDAISETLVTESIKQTQQDINRGLRAFAADPRLLTSQSELYSLLANNAAALTVLEKAFNFGPQSILVARRLAAAYEARDDFDGANDVLLKCLNHNIGNHDLHAQIGMNYVRKAADNIDAELLRNASFHLGRSIQAGDRRYEERFWYARALFLENNYAEARKLFAITKDAPLPTRQKRETRGFVRKDGKLVTYLGEITQVFDLFGFITCDELAGKVFVDARDVPTGSLQTGAVVSFVLGFNYFGAVAKELEISLI